MTAHFVYRLIFATFAVSWALPGIAQETVDPDTLLKVRARVELYYQTWPSLRPTPASLASRPAPTCSTPRYPRAGRENELEGTTVLNFQINADGRATNARLGKSSGWAVLDEAALEALSVCEFKPQDPPKWMSLSYKFHLD